MDNKKDIKDELKGLSPLLSGIKKDNAFKVPKDYFKSLPDKVLEQVQVTKNITEKATDQPSWLNRLIENIAVLFQPKYAVGFATALILIVAAVYINQNSGDQLNDSNLFVSQYIEENIDDFDAELLWEASVFENDDELEDDTGSDEFFDELIDELNDDELEMLL